MKNCEISQMVCMPYGMPSVGPVCRGLTQKVVS